MFIPHADRVTSLFNGRSTNLPPFQSAKQPRFSLDMSGVAGLLGGDDAVSAMTAVHVYGNRRWLGWYNTPGSFQIAKRFSSFAKSMFSRGISNSSSKSLYMDPTALRETVSCMGPKFRAARSGTVIEETGYPAAPSRNARTRVFVIGLRFDGDTDTDSASKSDSEPSDSEPSIDARRRNRRTPTPPRRARDRSPDHSRDHRRDSRRDRMTVATETIPADSTAAFSFATPAVP